MIKNHSYSVEIRWTGNKGSGTSDYKAYERSHFIQAPGKPVIIGTSDPAFRGDENNYNPEELLVASLSGCHMLWYLHLCAVNNIIVIDYTDNATGTMAEDNENVSKFTEVTLHPVVTVQDESMIEKANQLHAVANRKCFIANSVNFPIHHKPICMYKVE